MDGSQGVFFDTIGVLKATLFLRVAELSDDGRKKYIR